MKYLIPLFLILTGCLQKETYIGIVHYYIIDNAIKICKNNGGLHYIVAKEIITAKDGNYGNNGSYPCSDTYKIRCQDDSLHDFDDGAVFCFISRSQIKESLGEER